MSNKPTWLNFCESLTFKIAVLLPVARIFVGIKNVCEYNVKGTDFYSTVNF